MRELSAYERGQVFPAPAGMNRNHVSQDASGWSVPRACGDEPLWRDHATVWAAVFPAPAGMNRPLSGASTWEKSVPRACGDEPPPELSLSR